MYCARDLDVACTALRYSRTSGKKRRAKQGKGAGDEAGSGPSVREQAVGLTSQLGQILEQLLGHGRHSHRLLPRAGRLGVSEGEFAASPRRGKLGHALHGPSNQALQSRQGTLVAGACHLQPLWPGFPTRLGCGGSFGGRGSGEGRVRLTGRAAGEIQIKGGVQSPS